MNSKILTIIIVIALALIGAYVAYRSVGNPSNNGTNATSTPPQEQVQAQEVKIGTGREATPGSRVSVLYVGQLQDGTVFDSSAAHGNEPLTFVLGEPGLIAGFQIGVNGMKEGGERLIAIPPSLGYGSNPVRENPSDPNSRVVIPANSTIIFRIQMVKVGPATTTPGA